MHSQAVNKRALERQVANPMQTNVHKQWKSLAYSYSDYSLGAHAEDLPLKG